MSRGSYHGWRVIASLFVVGMMVYGGGLYAFTVFVPALSAEFGWGRAVTGGLVSVFWFTAPFTLLGNYLDKRLGSFWLIVAGVIIAAMAMMALGLARTAMVMLILRALMGFAKILMACGVNVMAATWFRRKFGLAIALCYAGWHFGGLTLAPLAQFLIDHEGWRSTALIMGALIFLIGLPPLIAWARIPSPAALGLIIDGETGASTAYQPALPTLMQGPAYSGSRPRSPAHLLAGCGSDRARRNRLRRTARPRGVSHQRLPRSARTRCAVVGVDGRICCGRRYQCRASQRSLAL